MPRCCTWPSDRRTSTRTPPASRSQGALKCRTTRHHFAHGHYARECTRTGGQTPGEIQRGGGIDAGRFHRDLQRIRAWVSEKNPDERNAWDLAAPWYVTVR